MLLKVRIKVRQKEAASFIFFRGTERDLNEKYYIYQLANFIFVKYRPQRKLNWKKLMVVGI
jgi:hypothetical protein